MLRRIKNTKHSCTKLLPTLDREIARMQQLKGNGDWDRLGKLIHMMGGGGKILGGGCRTVLL